MLLFQRLCLYAVFIRCSPSWTPSVKIRIASWYDTPCRVCIAYYAFYTSFPAGAIMNAIQVSRQNEVSRRTKWFLWILIKYLLYVVHIPTKLLLCFLFVESKQTKGTHLNCTIRVSIVQCGREKKTPHCIIESINKRNRSTNDRGSPYRETRETLMPMWTSAIDRDARKLVGAFKDGMRSSSAKLMQGSPADR